jgi:hypothetical protein
MTKPKAHFLHIGKTGGTAVQQALEPHLHAGKYAIVLEPHATRLADVPPGEAVFFLLRQSNFTKRCNPSCAAVALHKLDYGITRRILYN